MVVTNLSNLDLAEGFQNMVIWYDSGKQPY